uniref:Uncharacterized protein n=1 Tax=Arundo donax TaxID=35708 RepID=A0A0A9HAZ0_ARUDO
MVVQPKIACVLTSGTGVCL